MPYTRERIFEWECPAHVVAVLDGVSFVADLDLGFHVRMRVVVVTDGIEPISEEALQARKQAQLLLKDADLILRTRRLTHTEEGVMAVVADVAYSPFHEPRSEAGSFAAAMLATGLVKKGRRAR